MRRDRAWLVLLLVYMAGIHVFSVLPGYDAAGDSGLLRWRVGGTLANFLHVVVYAGLVWLWFRYFKIRSVGARTATLLAVGIAMAYGILNEWVQLYVPGRSADVGDVFFNFAGTLGGGWLAIWTSRRIDGKQR